MTALAVSFAIFFFVSPIKSTSEITPDRATKV